LEIRLGAQLDVCYAEELFRIFAAEPVIHREQTFRFFQPVTGAINPGLLVAGDGVRYTFPLRACEQALSDTGPLRADAHWALPLPAHIWHGGGWVALYAVDRTRSAGTLDFEPGPTLGSGRLGIYLPDTTTQVDNMNEQIYQLPRAPEHTGFSTGECVTLSAIIAAQVLGPDDEPLLVAEQLLAQRLLAEPRPALDLVAVAERVGQFYHNCGLWQPDALGPGRGWFTNMWVFTRGPEPRNTGSGSGYFDLGWGEGIAVQAIAGLTRQWRRTGRTDLLAYVDEITRNIELFRRGPVDPAAYYDRSDGHSYFDFVHKDMIWMHSLGLTGAQLSQTYIENPAYPQPEVRETWRSVAQSIADFIAARQTADGDVPNALDGDDRDPTPAARRTVARAIVCGLWSNIAAIADDRQYLERALRLARTLAPEIERFRFDSEMIDAQTAPCLVTDGESAFYVLEGLVPLYEATRDPLVLRLCHKAVAMALTWMYFYDVPKGHRGVARGGHTCRMPDFPLLFPGGTAKGVEPLLRLAKASDQPFFRQIAAEMVHFIASYQIDEPDRPWHGGIIHALDQSSGKWWGPGKLGQVDTGMSTGNCLAALEYWLAHEA
jgi:hypothetical protein